MNTFAVINIACKPFGLNVVLSTYSFRSSEQEQACYGNNKSSYNHHQIYKECWSQFALVSNCNRPCSVRHKNSSHTEKYKQSTKQVWKKSAAFFFQWIAAVHTGAGFIRDTAVAFTACNQGHKQRSLWLYCDNKHSKQSTQAGIFE